MVELTIVCFIMVGVMLLTHLAMGKLQAPKYSKLCRDAKKLPITRLHHPYAMIGDYKVWGCWIGDTYVMFADCAAMFKYNSPKTNDDYSVRLFPLYLRFILSKRGVTRDKCAKPTDTSFETIINYEIDYML